MHEVEEFYRRWPKCRKCFYCGVRTVSNRISQKREPRRITVDHVIPLSAGGKDEFGNIVWACQKCNERKASYPLEVFREITGFDKFFFEKLMY